MSEDNTKEQKSDPVEGSELENFRWASTYNPRNEDIVVAIFDAEHISSLLNGNSADLEITFTPKSPTPENPPFFDVTAKVIGGTTHYQGYYPCPRECQEYTVSKLWDEQGIIDKTTKIRYFNRSHVLKVLSFNSTCIAFRFHEGWVILGMFPASLTAERRIKQYNKSIGYVYTS